nr:hypothetical protein [uncultured Acetatifactor sp.]
MNKSGDSATMYRTIPAVAGLNKVEGFDPSSLLGHTVSPTTGEEGLQLGLAYKKLWFRLAYPEGRLQTEKVSLTEQMAVFEARVYLHHGDAAPVSSFVFGCAKEDAPRGRYIQAAQDQAMDAALTDAGFGLQFADVCTDGRMAGDGEKPVHPGAGDAATEKNPARNAGSAGAVVSAGNAVHAGNVVRPFPGTSADAGTKKAPAQGAQPFGARQPVQTAAMPQGQAAPTGTGQLVRTATMPQNQGRQPIGTRQSVQTASMPQSQGRQLAGNGQPVQAAAMPQNQGRQPTGARQPILAAAIPQGQTTPTPPAGARQPAQAAMLQGTGLPVAGTGKPIQAVVPQGQDTHLAGDRQGVPPVLPQKGETPPTGIRQPAQTVMPREQGMLATGNKLPVPPAMPQKQEMPADGTGMSAQTVMPNNQGVPPAGNKLPVSPTMPQKQEPQPDGTGQPVQAVVPKDQGAQPTGKKQPVTPAMPQGQGVQHGSKENTAQLAAPAAPVSATSRKAAAGGSRSGEAVKGSTASGGQAASPNPDTEQGQDASSAGAVDTAHPAKGQRYFGNTKAAATAQQGQSGRLPVPPASPENKGAVQASGSTDTLPVPPMGKRGQADAEPAVAADALPVPAGSPGKEESRSSVLEAIALLNGQALPAGTSEGMAGESNGSIAGTATENGAAASMEAASTEGDLPANRETAQGEPVPRYTPDMPVEEIVSLMTLEEAGKVVVDTGVSKGQTIAEVAQRRPPSLKFYRYGGYKGPNNILRAAAQVMLDSIEGQKAS